MAKVKKKLKKGKSKQKWPKSAPEIVEDPGKEIVTPVEFKLTDAQKSEKGMEAAKLQTEVELLTYEKKKATDELAAKIKARSAKLRTLLHEIDAGVETKDTTCLEVKNFTTHQVEYWFEGSIVKTREMTEEDRQLEICTVTKSKASSAHQARIPDEDDQDVAGVIASETNRKTKSSAVDGARA